MLSSKGIKGVKVGFPLKIEVKIFLKRQPCHFSVMVICFVYVNIIIMPRAPPMYFHVKLFLSLDTPTKYEHILLFSSRILQIRIRILKYDVLKVCHIWRFYT